MISIPALSWHEKTWGRGGGGVMLHKEPFVNAVVFGGKFFSCQL